MLPIDAPFLDLLPSSQPDIYTLVQFYSEINTIAQAAGSNPYYNSLSPFEVSQLESPYKQQLFTQSFQYLAAMESGEELPFELNFEFDPHLLADSVAQARYGLPYEETGRVIVNGLSYDLTNSIFHLEGVDEDTAPLIFELSQAAKEAGIDLSDREAVIGFLTAFLGEDYTTEDAAQLSRNVYLESLGLTGLPDEYQSLFGEATSLSELQDILANLPKSNINPTYWAGAADANLLLTASNLDDLRLVVSQTKLDE